MAWTDPVRYPNSAEIANNEDFLNVNVIDNLVYLKANPGPPVFTNEAARDAAITSPTEGMYAYITASTVAAATGATTTVPTGIQTIYNGAAWVCVTEVGAFSTTQATTTSASYVTTLTGDATAVSVTLSTGTTARIDMSSLANSTTTGNGYLTYSVSGATTIAASDVNMTAGGSNTNFVGSARSAIITGLTAGTNTFTLNYRTNTGTETFYLRNLIVKGVA